MENVTGDLPPIIPDEPDRGSLIMRKEKRVLVIGHDRIPLTSGALGEQCLALAGNPTGVLGIDPVGADIFIHDFRIQGDDLSRLRRLVFLIKKDRGQAAAASGGKCPNYLETGSFNVRSPSSSSINTAAAVNVLVIEASKNFVAGVLGISLSASARP